MSNPVVEELQGKLDYQEDREEELQGIIQSLNIIIETRQQIQRHRTERLLSMLREIVIVIEGYEPKP